MALRGLEGKKEGAVAEGAERKKRLLQKAKKEETVAEETKGKDIP